MDKKSQATTIIILLVVVFSIVFMFYFYNGSKNNQEEKCTPSWHCGEWSNCNNETQTRTCTDNNKCNNLSNVPVLSQTCNQNDYVFNLSIDECSPNNPCSSDKSCIFSDPDQKFTCVNKSSFNDGNIYYIENNECISILFSEIYTKIFKGPFYESLEKCQEVINCSENWVCGESIDGCVIKEIYCDEGICDYYAEKQKTCTDSNNCGSVLDKPSEIETCRITFITNAVGGYSGYKSGTYIIYDYNSDNVAENFNYMSTLTAGECPGSPTITNDGLLINKQNDYLYVCNPSGSGHKTYRLAI